MEGNFLAIRNYLFSIEGLKLIDIVILAKVEEFQRNGKTCYMTNEQFADMTHNGVDAVKKSLDRLEDMKLIHRETKVVKGNGKANKRRTIICNVVGCKLT